MAITVHPLIPLPRSKGRKQDRDQRTASAVLSSGACRLRRLVDELVRCPDHELVQRVRIFLDSSIVINAKPMSTGQYGKNKKSSRRSTLNSVGKRDAI
jgi:hypothetical protein